MVLRLLNLKARSVCCELVPLRSANGACVEQTVHVAHVNTLVQVPPELHITFFTTSFPAMWWGNIKNINNLEEGK